MRVVGIDGCRLGWLCVELTEDRCAAEVHGSIESVWQRFHASDLMLIDVPIGLWDQGSRQRLCELEARKALGARRSCVFTPPLRPSLACGSYEDACQRNFELSGRKLSRQAWGIAPKIREVDRLLRDTVEARSVLRETHPEVCFLGFNGRESVSAPKKTKAGRERRHQILSKLVPRVDELVHQVRDRYRKAQVADDDIYDALVAAVTAERYAGGEGKTLPESPEVDTLGLRMEMVVIR